MNLTFISFIAEIFYVVLVCRHQNIIFIHKIRVLVVLGVVGQVVIPVRKKYRCGAKQRKGDALAQPVALFLLCDEIIVPAGHGRRKDLFDRVLGKGARFRGGGRGAVGLGSPVRQETVAAAKVSLGRARDFLRDLAKGAQVVHGALEIQLVYGRAFFKACLCHPRNRKIAGGGRRAVVAVLEPSM